MEQRGQKGFDRVAKTIGPSNYFRLQTRAMKLFVSGFVSIFYKLFNTVSVSFANLLINDIVLHLTF